MKKRTFFILILIILAILTRLIFLDLRPLHHDESVNYYFAEKIITGKGYSYDPTNYHGPFYFFVLTLSFILLGFNEFSLRLPAAIFGVALIILPLLIKFKEKIITNKQKILISFFIIFSPSILYYSRYSIHEITLVFFTLISIYSFSRIIIDNDLFFLPYFALSLAFMFTIKETTILLFPVYLIIFLFNFKELKKIKLKNNLSIVFFSIVLFLFIYTICFSSFFTNINGLSDSIKGYMPWTDRGINEKGHDKPFFYYTLLLIMYEFPLVILGFFGVYYSFKKNNLFFKNISFLFMILFLIYSIIPYKTPWLIINLSLPLCFLAGFSVSNIKARYSHVILLMTIIFLVTSSVLTSFIYSYNEENKFAYAHTDKDLLRLVKEIKPDNSKVLVYSDSYWPLPFYLRKNQVFYQKSDNFLNRTELNKYDYIIFDKSSLDLIRPDNYSIYTLRPRLEIYLKKN